MMRPYLKDPAAIYAQSFATVREEARLDRFDPGMAALATRVIHACGMIEVADRLAFSSGAFVRDKRRWPLVRRCCATVRWLLLG